MKQRYWEEEVWTKTVQPWPVKLKWEQRHWNNAERNSRVGCEHVCPRSLEQHILPIGQHNFPTQITVENRFYDVTTLWLMFGYDYLVFVWEGVFLVKINISLIQHGFHNKQVKVKGTTTSLSGLWHSMRASDFAPLITSQLHWPLEGFVTATQINIISFIICSS